MKQWGPVTVWKLNLVRGRMIEVQTEKKLEMKKSISSLKIKALRPGRGIESFNQENYKFVKTLVSSMWRNSGAAWEGLIYKTWAEKKWELQVKGREYFFKKTRKESPKSRETKTYPGSRSTQTTSQDQKRNSHTLLYLKHNHKGWGKETEGSKRIGSSHMQRQLSRATDGNFKDQRSLEHSDVVLTSASIDWRCSPV